MPGITAIAGPGATAAALAGMERELFGGALGLRRESAAVDGFACAVHARRGTSGVLERDGTCLAFDGYIAAGVPRGRDLLDWLLDGFLEQGRAFLERLDGSFQIAVHRPGETHLFADPTASRRLFYSADERGLFVSPEVAPLRGFGKGERIDRTNLVQFLVSGRFFAGQSLLPWVRQLLPGEAIAWREGRLERRRHFLYQVSPAEADRRGLAARLAELGDLLEHAILRAFAQAQDPIIPLTGGYDSRILFHTIARQVDDPRRLTTVLWGQRMQEPGTDNAAAEEIARRRGVRHLSLPWRTGVLPEQFEDMFLAQSGMTEMVFTHSDELAVFRTLAGLGFASVLRGDECFGPKGGDAADVREALCRVSMSRATDVPESRRWFLGGGADWLAAHDAAVEALVAAVPAAPGELRDTLYGRERLPALLHHHNYHKLHFVEMVNPFLDADVLRFWSALPGRWRVDKTLLREWYHARIGDHVEVPIASKDNGADWSRGLRESPALAAWVRERLSRLPEPLDRDYFLGKLDAVLRDEPEPSAPPAVHRVPAVRLVARAVVLGHWLRTWAA